eukprot:2688606-Pyramimonas_sp.AAC.1
MLWNENARAYPRPAWVAALARRARASRRPAYPRDVLRAWPCIPLSARDATMPGHGFLFLHGFSALRNF